MYLFLLLAEIVKGKSDVRKVLVVYCTGDLEAQLRVTRTYEEKSFRRY
jgi:hypothetical protein